MIQRLLGKAYKIVTDFVENRYKTLFQRKETISDLFSVGKVYIFPKKPQLSLSLFFFAILPFFESSCIL